MATIAQRINQMSIIITTKHFPELSRGTFGPVLPSAPKVLYRVSIVLAIDIGDVISRVKVDHIRLQFKLYKPVQGRGGHEEGEAMILERNKDNGGRGCHQQGCQLLR